MTPLQKPEVRVLKQDPGSLELEIIFPPLEVTRSARGSLLKMGALLCKPDAQGNLLPAFQLIIPGRESGIKLQLLEAQTATQTLKEAPTSTSRDLTHTAADATSQQSAARIGLIKKRPASRSAWAQAHYLGQYRRIPLTALEIEPVRWNAANREAVYLKSLKLRLEFPLSLEPGNRPVPLPGALGGLSQSLPIPASTNPPGSSPPRNNSIGQIRLKIFVSREGIYHLSSADLAAWGVDLSSVDPRTLRLENRGIEQPIYVAGEADGRFDEGDYIEFWGENLHGTFTQQNPEIYGDLYTDVNVYWLSWGGALGGRLVHESGEVVEVNELKMFRATSYPFLVHQEQNNYYNRLSQVSPDSLKEHWYFDSGIQASQTRNYSVYLPYPDDDALINARVRVNLQGLTYPDAYGQGGQHHVYVSLNDQNSPALEAGSSGASWWVGQTGVLLDAQGSEGISSTVLDYGQNTLSLFCPVDTDAGPNDTVLLNWFEITYQRLFKADADLIRFAPPEAAVDTLVDYRIEGFTSSQIDVFKIGQSKIINAEITPYQQNDQTFYKLHFQDRPYGSPQYVALTPAAKLPPDSTRLDEGSDLYGLVTTGAPLKLLIIAHRSFENHPELEDYVARRQAGLGRTELVFMDDVFDEFSDGIYDPQAIKNLLQVMPTPPDYLLLVGDASYDTRNAYGMGGNLLPAAYIQTKAYGAVASDFWYSLLDDDMLPDLAVGRISCRDPEELTNYLNKLEEYETNPEPGAWRSSHLFVSGTGGVPETSFLNLSQQIISLTPDNLLIERLATDPIGNPFYGGTTDLIDLFDGGALVVDYNGHGAGAVWSDNSLFRLENLPQLSNQGRYPFVTNFTCFIGAFDTPGQGTILGEEFIFEPEKGAIAVLGSTGLGWFMNGGWLQEELVQALYSQPDLTLGELINIAKIAYYAYYGPAWPEESFDTIHLMSLLGDPSMKLAFAAEQPPAQAAPQFVQSGDSVHVSLAGDYSGFEGTLRVYDNNDYSILQFGQPIEVPLVTSPGGLQADFMQPALGDTAELTGGTYRLSFWDPSGEASYRSAASFFLQDIYQDSLMVDSLSPYPDPVYARDSFGFRAKILAPNGIASAYAHFHIEKDNGLVIVEDDSLIMDPTGVEPWYETGAVIDSSAYHYGVSDSVSVWVQVSDSLGNTIHSDNTPFVILDSRANPDWVDGSLTMRVKENQAALIMQISNLGETAVDSLDISFYQVDGSGQFLGGTVIYNLQSDSVAEAFILASLPYGLFDFEVHMNDSGWVDDKDPNLPYAASLLVDHFSISRQSGSADTLTIGDYFQVFLPDSSITAPLGVMTLRERNDLEVPSGQQGLSFALQDSGGILSGLGLEIGFLGGIGVLGDSLYIAAELTAYNGGISPDVSWHWQESGQPFWRLVESDGDTVALTPHPEVRYQAKVQQAGSYSLLRNGDHQGPNIEITVEGQIYTPGGYVPNQPKISALVQDAGGVSSQPGTYWISVDGTVVDSSQVSASPEGSGQVLTISINPSFNVGEHSVSVVAQDLFGNVGTTSINFQVAGQFHLDFLGNYPNPLKDKTYFAYRLTEQTTEPVQIRIYTVSGRLIRTLYSSAAQEINYGEIYWDGRDEDGANIANGVYFYKFRARRSDEEIERTMKLAKLR